MVLTKEELIASLQNEVRILLHLAGKIDRNKLDYRPTPKQRSTMELLQYLVVMGPMLIRAIKPAHLTARHGAPLSPKPMPRISIRYSQLLKESRYVRRAARWIFGGRLSGRDRSVRRRKIEPGLRAGEHGDRGHAAYRTQLFLYLKACGRDELNTMNLWAGVDAPMPAM